MTNELLGYIDKVLLALIGLLLGFEAVGWTPAQVGLIVSFWAAVGGMAVFINSHRKGGAVQTVRNKAVIAEEAGLVSSEGPPPNTP